VKQKVPRVIPFLQEAGWVPQPAPCSLGQELPALLTAIGDRLRVAGDILNFEEFFVDDQRMEYDAGAVAKSLSSPESRSLLQAYATAIATVDPFDAATLESHMHEFVNARALKLGQLVHPLRVAVTGKSTGCGMFETLAVLGRDRCLRRIGRLLEQLA